LLNKSRLGSGLGITASSWAQFWRQKNLINGGIAAWNTYAQISNIVSAVRFVPEAIGNVFSAFKGDDEEDDRALLLMLAVVLVAVGAGVHDRKGDHPGDCSQVFSNSA
jgi:hypothetical protein